MEIFQFEQFRAIAECGSMSEAARKLYLTQPTLSRNLKKLEGELGCKLFTRVRNRMQLTACGQIAYDYYARISKIGDEMLVAIDEARRSRHARNDGSVPLPAGGIRARQVALA